MPTHPTARSARLVNPAQGRYVLGALALLIAVVGKRSCLGIILQQARSEVASLLRSQGEFDYHDELRAA